MSLEKNNLSTGIVFAFGALAYGCAIAALRRYGRKKNARLKNQWRLRPPETDEDFVARCGLQLGEEDAKIAVASRAIIAGWENIPATTLHASDRWDRELTLLGVTVHFEGLNFADALREQLGFNIEKREIEHLLYPDLPPRGATLRDFVCRVVQAVRRTQEPKLQS